MEYALQVLKPLLMEFMAVRMVEEFAGQFKKHYPAVGFAYRTIINGTTARNVLFIGKSYQKSKIIIQAFIKLCKRLITALHLR
jgi:hypothetical protein